MSGNAMMKRARGLAPKIIDRGHSVLIVAQDTEENREYFSFVEGANLVLFSSSGFVPEIRQKAQVIKARTPDVVYSCGWGLRNLPALLAETTLVEHAELLSENHESTGLQRTKNLFLEWLSVFAADGLVLASQYLMSKYEGRDGLDNIRQLYLPYGVSDRDVQRPRNPFGEERRRILYMGSLYESYGILDIVRSIPRVVNEMPTVEYIILGDGPDRKAAVNLAKALGVYDHIQFEGFVSDDLVDEYLSSADVFLAPLYNTVKDKARCPSKIPIYMLHRKPIVTCKIGEAPAYLKDHGFYYSPGDPQSMAHKILRAIQVSNPVDYDLQSISWDRLSEKFLAWLRKDFKAEKKAEGKV